MGPGPATGSGTGGVASTLLVADQLGPPGAAVGPVLVRDLALTHPRVGALRVSYR